MGAKVYADRVSSEPEPAACELELEAEVEAVAAWFEALPAEWRSYFDREAQSGRQAYGWA